jgi:predicted ATPase
VISELRIQNFKSIHDLTLKPGRVTVFIGENGSGKSNVLEAIAFAAGAAANKLDNEFLYNRGIRVTEWKWMQTAFANGHELDAKLRGMSFRVRDEEIEDELIYEVQPHFWEKDGGFSGWNVAQSPDERDLQVARHQMSEADREQIVEYVKKTILNELTSEAQRERVEKTFAANREEWGIRITAQRVRKARGEVFAETTGLRDFLIYAPENTVLRTPPPEGAIQPLGTKGEGLFRLLQSFAEPKFADRLAEMKDRLHLFGWFDDFLSPDEAATAQARLQIRDRWLAPERAVFDQRSANEGFLYLLFYFTALMSWRTPRFFAFDNVDNALNPKLCSALMRQIAELAKKYDKQVICTTHNPAILDGLNINDDEQRLFTVLRDADGHTIVNRVQPPKPQEGKPPMKLSAAFLAGHIGGLPDHF